MVIYRGLNAEVNRISRAERFQVQSGPFEYRVVRPAFLDPDIVDEIKKRIAMTLFAINGIILVFSGGLGYILAGKTLEPIAEMVEEQNRFISDASHELRTPLTSIKTSIEVGMRDKKMDLISAKKLISENLYEINKLQSLSEGLLQLTQYKSGNNNLKFETLSLKKVVDEAVKKMSVIAREKKIIIENNVKDFKVSGNKYSLTDLMVILLDNAVKYSPEGGKVLVDVKKSKRAVTLSVIDFGIGISKKDLPHIFDRFYRAESARDRNGPGGYGLGLSIAKKIVDIHNGEIVIESVIKKGTTVKISLPYFS
jgi:signal transduction histidine kinase